MRIIIFLAFGLIFSGMVHAQVGSSISADGTAPNDNAMLDVQSPATGAGKGMLIPRVSLAQRTTTNASLAGGLLDNSGNLRGGAAQGLIVYQTDGTQGLYFNTSLTAAPVWVHLGEGSDLNMQGHIITNAIYYGDGRGITNISVGAFNEADPRWASASNAIVADIATRLVSNVWVAAGSTTNYLPRTGGTMSGALNMSAQMVTNVSHIDFNGTDVSVGQGANGSAGGAAVGRLANGSGNGAAVGQEANGYYAGAAVGYLANGYNCGMAMGRSAHGFTYGVSVGFASEGSYYGAAIGSYAVGTNFGAAIGYSANGSDYGVAIGSSATGNLYGAAVGYQANGYSSGAAVGYMVNGYSQGAAIGREANGYSSGAAVGESVNGYSGGAAVGKSANGSSVGAAVGQSANGYSRGVAMGREANGSDYGVAVGYLAIGTHYGAAMGYEANGSDYGAAMGVCATGNYYGVAVGDQANGSDNGAAMGYLANGNYYGVAVGRQANGYNGGAAIGTYADAGGGTERIAIGHNVTNTVNNSAVIRGTLYLDGGTGINYRTTFGSGSWSNKAFEIDHPLDPENKVLRHFCLEGPQVWNVYAGNAQLKNGLAVVELPEYYSALNLVGSEIYSLTPVGGWAPIWVHVKVFDNVFVIAGQADLEVSWTIKVLRNDLGCREDLRRRPVEQMKSEIR